MTRIILGWVGYEVDPEAPSYVCYSHLYQLAVRFCSHVLLFPCLPELVLQRSSCFVQARLHGACLDAERGGCFGIGHAGKVKEQDRGPLAGRQIVHRTAHPPGQIGGLDNLLRTRLQSGWIGHPTSAVQRF